MRIWYDSKRIFSWIRFLYGYYASDINIISYTSEYSMNVMLISQVRLGSTCVHAARET